MGSLISDRPSPFSAELALPKPGLNLDQPDPDDAFWVSDAKYGQLDQKKKNEYMVVLDCFIH